MSNSFPTIRTPRLILNQLQLSDVDLITKYAQNSNVAKYLVNMPEPYYKKDAIGWVERSHLTFQERSQYTFAIREKNCTDFIGAIGLIINKQHQKANLGYWLAEKYWNKGYMTETLKGIIPFAFNELKLNKLYATHHEKNPGSGKVMENAGMVKEAYLLEEFFKNGEYWNAHRYCIIREKHLNKR